MQQLFTNAACSFNRHLLGGNENTGSSDYFVYSYFEKGCRKKCTRQSRKVLWVVLSSGTAYWSYPILPLGMVACTFFSTTFFEIAVCYTLLRFVQHPVNIVLGKTFYVILLCHSCSPVLVVNLSIYNNFNNKDLVRSGLIEIFLFSNCCTYILEGDLSDSIKTSCVLSFCRTKSN